jgi:hypothetical protein
VIDTIQLKPSSGALQSRIARLIERGDVVEIRKGKLIIIPISGRPVPKQWLKENTALILSDIANLTGHSIFIYIGYSLKERTKYTQDTLSLQFINLQNNSDAYAAINVSLKRQRKGLNGKSKDSLLPKGEFSPPKSGGFVKFWIRTGLKMYNPSRLCRYMGNLKALIFTASYSTTSTAKKKLANMSLDILTVTYEEIIAAMPSRCPTHAQSMPSSCLSPMPKETNESQQSRGSHDNSSTGDVNHGKRLQGSAVNSATDKSKSTGCSVSYADMKNGDTWLDDYDKADGTSPY